MTLLTIFIYILFSLLVFAFAIATGAMLFAARSRIHERGADSTGHRLEAASYGTQFNQYQGESGPLSPGHRLSWPRRFRHHYHFRLPLLSGCLPRPQRGTALSGSSRPQSQEEFSLLLCAGGRRHLGHVVWFFVDKARIKLAKMRPRTAKDTTDRFIK